MFNNIYSDASKPYNYIFPRFRRDKKFIEIPSHFNMFGLDKMLFNRLLYIDLYEVLTHCVMSY